MANPAHPPLVFVYGYYGCGNVGDELLLSATCGGILQRWPAARFRVRNLGSVAVEPRLAPRVEETGIERIMEGPGGKATRAIAYLRAAAVALRGCDAFVLGGGTLLHANGSVASLALLAAMIVIARRRGIPVIGLGIGAAHLDGSAARRLLGMILARMSDLGVRDAASLALIGARQTARATADLVYGWWPATVARGEREPAVIVTLWSLPPAGEAHVLSSLAGALARVAQGRGLAVRILVFQHGEENRGRLSDHGAATRLQTLLAARRIASTVERPAAEPAALAHAFAGGAVHVGARFHAAVVATLLGMPCVGLASDPKVSSLCDAFAMPWLSLHDMDEPRLAAAMEAAIGRPVDASVLDGMRQRSCANFAWFDRHPQPSSSIAPPRSATASRDAT